MAVSLSTVPRLSLLSWQSYRLRVGMWTCRGGRAVLPTRCAFTQGSNNAAKISCSFQETAPRNTVENTVKHRNGGAGLVVANHRCGGESSVVVTTPTLTLTDTVTVTSQTKLTKNCGKQTENNQKVLGCFRCLAMPARQNRKCDMVCRTLQLCRITEN